MAFVECDSSLLVLMSACKRKRERDTEREREMETLSNTVCKETMFLSNHIKLTHDLHSSHNLSVSQSH